MSKYLLEVGCEELPYKFIPSAIQQLKSGFENFLKSNKVEFEDVKVYATPRRLAVIVSGCICAFFSICNIIFLSKIYNTALSIFSFNSSLI